MALSFFVREPWPSPWTGTEIEEWLLAAGSPLPVLDLDWPSASRSASQAPSCTL